MLCAQGLGGSCSELVLQVWLPAGSQAVDRVAHGSPALGMCTPAAGAMFRVGAHPGFHLWAPRPMIGVRAHLGLQLWSQTTDWSTHPPVHVGPVGPGSRATDQGLRPPRVSGVGAQSADPGALQPGFRCVLGLLICRSQSRG